MKYEKNRIYFKDNPYPKGHLIKEFKWSARVYPEDGLWFDLHLISDKYYAEDEGYEEEEDLPNWDAKIVWGNYHACSLSSTKWDIGGFLVGTEQKKFDFGKMDNLFFHLDKLPRPEDFDYDEDLPFSIYLLGHDDCADHQISFSKNSSNKFDIEWKGKIALAYSGDYDFNHEFYAFIENILLEEIYYPEAMSEEEAIESLKKYSENFEGLKLIPRL